MRYQEAAGLRVKEFETSLDRYFATLDAHPVLKDAMKYAVEGGGKRLRPILMLETYKMFNEDDRAIPFAIALELIHSYSLVHDDLPCMDDDDIRRGKPAVHKAFDEGIAVLTGDALLNAAWTLSMQAALQQGTEASKRASFELSVAAGPNGMLDGQMMDLYDDIQNIDQLEILYAKKTGCLISVAVAVGGVLGGADEEQMQRLNEFSHHLSMAFQIQDDILDEAQDREEDHMSILRYVTTQEAHHQMMRHTELALESLRALKALNTDKLSSITEALIQRKS